MPSRRTFLASLPAASVAALTAATATGALGAAAPPGATAAAAAHIIGCSLPLVTGWEFTYDQPASDPEPVTIPHTWQSLAGQPDFVGVGTYRLLIQAPEAWSSRFVRVEFEAATHTAHVLLNGTPVGEHVGKGYTAFTVDLSDALRYGQPNTLTVHVDNRPADRMLPRNESYDWTNDGGLIRPVNLLITPQIFIERVEIDARPDLSSGRGRLTMKALVRNTTSHERSITLGAQFRLEGSANPKQAIPQVTQSLAAGASRLVELGEVLVEAPSLWHFDAPHLYAADFSLESQAGEHGYVETFGFRTFEVRGTAFYLNGSRFRSSG